MNNKIMWLITGGLTLLTVALVVSAVTKFPWWRMEGWPTAAEWQAFGAVGTMVVAIVAASYAWKQIAEARALRREQAQPYVLATPIPELSDGRHVCLAIKNYGPRPAHDIKVHFPEAWVTVPSKAKGSEGTWEGTSDLRLAVSTLAPGQEIYEWLNIMEAADIAGVRSAIVEVTYCDSRSLPYANKYRISHGPLGLFGKADPLTEIERQLDGIRHILNGWKSPDGRSLNVESPNESRSRIFGE